MSEAPLIDDARRWDVFMHAVDKGGKTDEVLDRAMRLVKIGADFMEVSGWMTTEWSEELVPFRVHVERIVSVNDGRGDANGQPGFAVVELADDEGRRRESYHRVGSLNNAAYRKVLNDAKRFMDQGVSVVLHCGYEPNTTGWTTVVNGAKVTPPHLKRVFHIEKRGGQAQAPAQQAAPAAQSTPPAPVAPTPEPAPTPPPAAEQPRMAPDAAPQAVSESVADLERRLAEAKAQTQQGVQEVFNPPVTATAAPAGEPALPSDAEWQKLYGKLKQAQRKELNQRAESEGWAGHNPTQAHMAQAWVALEQGGYLSEDQIMAILSPQGAAA